MLNIVNIRKELRYEDCFNPLNESYFNSTQVRYFPQETNLVSTPDLTLKSVQETIVYEGVLSKSIIIIDSSSQRNLEAFFDEYKSSYTSYFLIVYIDDIEHSMFTKYEDDKLVLKFIKLTINIPDLSLSWVGMPLFITSLLDESKFMSFMTKDGLFHPVRYDINVPEVIQVLNSFDKGLDKFKGQLLDQESEISTTQECQIVELKEIPEFSLNLPVVGSPKLSLIKQTIKENIENWFNSVETSRHELLTEFMQKKVHLEAFEPSLNIKNTLYDDSHIKDYQHKLQLTFDELKKSYESLEIKTQLVTEDFDFTNLKHFLDQKIQFFPYLKTQLLSFYIFPIVFLIGLLLLPVQSYTATITYMILGVATLGISSAILTFIHFKEIKMQIADRVDKLNHYFRQKKLNFDDHVAQKRVELEILEASENLSRIDDFFQRKSASKNLNKYHNAHIKTLQENCRSLLVILKDQFNENASSLQLEEVKLFPKIELTKAFTNNAYYCVQLKEFKKTIPKLFTYATI